MMQYQDLKSRIEAICENETDEISLMSTVCCELHQSDERFDWTGFYRVVGKDLLKIGPYQGGHGCLVIPFERGVCGACARTQKPILVRNVDDFDGHIACSTTTQSELVLPVFDGVGGLIGVLDIDSNQPAAFDQNDLQNLEEILASVFAQVNRS